MTLCLYIQFKLSIIVNLITVLMPEELQLFFTMGAHLFINPNEHSVTKDELIFSSPNWLAAVTAICKNHLLQLPS